MHASRTLQRFPDLQEAKLNSGELSECSFRDYFQTCELLIIHFGKRHRIDDLRPTDFATLRATMAERCGVVTLKNEINRIRVVLKFALDERLIDRQVHYGQSFVRPSAKTLRRIRNEAGLRMFEAEEVNRLLESGDVTMRAMILLAVNGGLGNMDVSNLPESAIDFEGRMVELAMIGCEPWPIQSMRGYGRTKSNQARE